MPALERNTTRRGRSAVPRIFPRTRLWRRARASLTASFMLVSRRRSRPSAKRIGGGGSGGTGRFHRSVMWWSGSSSCALAYLAPHVLALVADALALVGLRRPHPANVGGSLADELLVDPLHDDLVRRRHLESNAGLGLDDDRVREADRKLEVASAQCSTVAHALDLEALLEALRHTLDHVRDQRARQPVQSPVLAALRRARDDDRSVLLVDLHAGRDLLGELAEGTVHLNAPGRDGDRDAGRKLDWLLADSTHRSSPPTQIVPVGRETRVSQGRRERAYLEGTCATEDTATRRVAACCRARDVRVGSVNITR